MTTRLLNRSGRAPRGRATRDALVAASLGRVAAADGVTVHAAALPLFRRGRDGLEQVVRVRVEPAAERITLHGPDGTAISGAGGTADLLVPEITAPARRRLTVLAAGKEVSGEVELTPQRKFTVHLVHHSHLDIGYTDPQGIVLRNHLEYLDAAVELGRQGDGGDPATRFRWAVESNFPMRTWLERRSPAVVEELRRLAHEDVIEVTAMPFNLHTEAASAEELARLLRTAVELRERYGFPIRSAMHTDVPGATTGWADALYEAGVRYLSAAHNWAGRSVPYAIGGQELNRLFWWRTPAGARLLTWFTDSAHGLAYMEGNLLGLADSYDDVAERLPLYLDVLAGRPFPYHEEIFGMGGLPEGLEITKEPYPHDLVHLRVQGNHSDNACPHIRPSEIARRWNEEWAYPRLITSTNNGFFATAEAELGGTADEFTGEWGDWWADGLGSGARPLGYNRRAQSLARTAETVHLVADLESGAATPVRADVDSVYDRVGLFDEHTWGAANPWHDHEHGWDSGTLQWARKSEFAHQAHDDAQDLLHAGVRRLGAVLPSPASSSEQSLATVVVYNTGGQVRTDRVKVFLPESVVASRAPLAAVDTRKQEQVPTRSSESNKGSERRAAPHGRFLEFVARNVPAMGWVRYDVVEAEEVLAHAPLASGPLLRNGFFEVRYDPKRAAVVSVVDRLTGRELVNTGALTGMNEYVYDTYGSASHINHQSSRLRAPDLSLFGSRAEGRNAAVLRAESSALGDVLEVEVHAPGVEWLRTTIELAAGVPCVHITNRLLKKPSTSKESVYFAYPFAGAGEPAAYEMTGSVDGHGVPHVPGAPRHMRAIRHWVGYEDTAAGYATAWATLEAPLVQFGTIHLPYQPFPSTISGDPEPATVYSWALNNIWDTNFPGQQQGEMTFRYALAGAAGEAPNVLGARLAASLTDPLVPVLATGAAGGTAASGSLLAVENPDVVLTSLGRPLDGSDGIAVRLRSLAAGPVEARVTTDAFRARSAAVTTLLEQALQDVPIRDGRLRVPIPAGASRTLLLRP